MNQIYNRDGGREDFLYPRTEIEGPKLSALSSAASSKSIYRRMTTSAPSGHKNHDGIPHTWDMAYVLAAVAIPLREK